MQAMRCNSAVPDPENGDRQTDGNRDGSDHGGDHGTASTAFCRRCDDRVFADSAGRCPDCGIFLAGNVGGAVIRRDRRAELRQTMATLEAGLTQDLGGPDQVTAAQALLIKQATHTAALASSLLSAVVKAGPGTEAGQKAAHAYLATVDRVHRALVALGIQRRTTDADPYLIIQEAVEAANRNGQDADGSTPSDNGGGPTPDPDGIATEAAAQDPDNGDSPADGTGVMGTILQATEAQL